MNPLERINDPEDAQRTALAGLQSRIRTAMPGVVTAVDLGRQVLSVQPAIQGQQDSANGDTANVNLPLLVDVPICWPRAGGFAITFPIAPGDEVLVVFGDRCIDAWWQSGGVGVALEQRMHDLSDAFAIPGPCSQPRKLAGVSATAMQMRNDAGTAYIEITASGFVNIVSTALTHNGKNVGATHTHGGVAAGGGTSGVPT
jgi:hypothetical protein